MQLRSINDGQEVEDVYVKNKRARYIVCGGGLPDKASKHTVQIVIVTALYARSATEYCQGDPAGKPPKEGVSRGRAAKGKAQFAGLGLSLIFDSKG